MSANISLGVVPPETASEARGCAGERASEQFEHFARAGVRSRVGVFIDKRLHGHPIHSLPARRSATSSC